MAMQKVIFAALACFSIAIFTNQTLSWARASNRKSTPLVPPDSKRPNLRGLDHAEASKAIERWQAEREQQEKQRQREHIDRMATEAWKGLLRVNEQQWAMIEPKIDKVSVLARTAQVRAYGLEDDAGGFHWNRPSRPRGPFSGKSRDQMPEQYRLIEELIDLLEDEKSKDEDIRKKMDALQQTRDNARKELAQVGRELAAVPMTPRQEAIFLIVGYID